MNAAAVQVATRSEARVSTKQHHNKMKKRGGHSVVKTASKSNFASGSSCSPGLVNCCTFLSASAKEAKSPDEKDMAKSHCMGSEDARGLL